MRLSQLYNILHFGKNNSVLIVFKITNCVEKLIDYRKISIDIIWDKYSGFKIPSKAIVYDNGLSYVVRNKAGYLEKVLVKILKENKNYCIVNSYTSEELKSLGYEISKINSLNKITLYDEIVIEPDLSELE